MRPAEPTGLRVCADPNNLPYSNDRLEGFENRLAQLVARELGFAEVSYTWWAQRRGFLRHTLNAHACDLVMGLPADVELALTTRPYYRSSYVFVARRDSGLAPSSLNDELLRHVRVGVALIGDDGANSPPAHALSRRGIVENVVGYSVYGDYATDSPPSRLIHAVARGEIDVAIAWGPLAGYYAVQQPVPLQLTQVSPSLDPPALPMAFDMSMAVRREEGELKDRLDTFIDTHRHEIDTILDRFHVPRAVREAGQ